MRRAERSHNAAKQAIRNENREAAIEAFLETILSFHRANQPAAAAHAAREALDHYPSERRVLRLISRLTATGGSQAEDPRGALMLLAAGGGEVSDENAGVDAPAPPTDQLAVLSLFPKSAFERLLNGSRFHQLGAGEELFHPGGMNGSIYIVTSGTVQVLEAGKDGSEVETARVATGGVLGVFSYMTGRPRSATARALTPVGALEIPSDVLDYECAKSEHFSLVLARFCRERLLLNLLSSLPGYRKLGHVDKAKLLGRFKLRDIDPGEEILGQGATEPYLALVVEGSVRVVQTSTSFAAELRLVEPGDCIGNIGSPPAPPASASLVAGELGCKLALLPSAATAHWRATEPAIGDPRAAMRKAGQLIAGGLFCASSATPAALVPAAWRRGFTTELPKVSEP